MGMQTKVVAKDPGVQISKPRSRIRGAATRADNNKAVLKALARVAISHKVGVQAVGTNKQDGVVRRINHGVGTLLLDKLPTMPHKVARLQAAKDPGAVTKATKA